MKKPSREFLLVLVCRILTVLYASLIFVLSSMPAPPQPPKEFLFPYIDLFEHAAEYSILGFLLFYSIVKSKKQYLKTNAFELSVIIGVLYSFTDELHQYFVPNRVMAIEDLFADSLGVLWGAFVAVALIVYLANRREEVAPTA